MVLKTSERITNRHYRGVPLNGGNNTIQDIVSSYPSCRVRLPDGSIAFSHCRFINGIISGTFHPSVEGVFELVVSIPEYQISKSVKLLVDRSKSNRIHLEVLLIDMFMI